MDRFCTLRTQRRGFAIFIGMALTVVIILIGVNLIEKLVPAARDVKGVENGNVAYYQASSSLEMGLSTMYGDQPGGGTGSGAGTLATSGFKLTVAASGSSVPIPGYGNSEYDPNWNVLAVGRPIQLKLPASFDPTKVAFEFRVPDLDRDGNWGENGSGDASTEGLAGAGTGVINWIIVGSGSSLTSEPAKLVTADDVNATTDVTISARTGNDLTGSTMTVAAFSSAEC